MKRILATALAALMLTGCGTKNVPEVTTVETAPIPEVTEPAAVQPTPEILYQSRFDTVTEIKLSYEQMLFAASDAISITNDIIY